MPTRWRHCARRRHRSVAPTCVSRSRLPPWPRIERRQQFTAVVQNIWYGLSLGSVLLLASAGLAITFGVMGVINMAHGEMVMIGAYTTYVVQELFSAVAPGAVDLSSLLALPIAFLVGGRCRRRHRARHHPLSLRPPARNAARHLGRQPDPAAGHPRLLRRQQRASLDAELHERLVRSARPCRSPTAACGSSSSRCSRSLALQLVHEG